jgi:hypothetical protein
MKTLRKLAVVAGMVVLCACASNRNGQGGDTAAGGDTGMGGEKAVDCSTVRCAACPEGQRPALKPPNCCKCIPA